MQTILHQSPVATVQVLLVADKLVAMVLIVLNCACRGHLVVTLVGKVSYSNALNGDVELRLVHSLEHNLRECVTEVELNFLTVHAVHHCVHQVELLTVVILYCVVLEGTDFLVCVISVSTVLIYPCVEVEGVLRPEACLAVLVFVAIFGYYIACEIEVACAGLGSSHCEFLGKVGVTIRIGRTCDTS